MSTSGLLRYEVLCSVAQSSGREFEAAASVCLLLSVSCQGN